MKVLLSVVAQKDLSIMFLGMKRAVVRRVMYTSSFHIKTHDMEKEG